MIAYLHLMDYRDRGMNDPGPLMILMAVIFDAIIFIPAALIFYFLGRSAKKSKTTNVLNKLAVGSLIIGTIFAIVVIDAFS